MGIKIYDDGIEDVYDITVKHNHNFFANGILVHNCVEIGKYPQTADGVSGWQGCNLTEINGAMCESVEQFMRACEASAIMGTLQAGYTDFKFLSPESKEIFEREALIGCSVTGWMNNPAILFDEANMRDGARTIKRVNRIVAELIGINPAARTTCVKPSGNASTILKTGSGIHGEHSERYFRHVQMNKDSEVAQLIAKVNPAMIEDSVWSAGGTDYCIAFPVTPPKQSIFKRDLLGVKQLEYVKLAQRVWIEEGTDESLCAVPGIRHNVSNTITVDDWDEVTKYVYDNRKWFCGISFLSARGDSAYPQAPFTEVFTAEQILSKYGVASLFASGMITRSLDAFGDLWKACATAIGDGEDLSIDTHENAMKRDWVRSFKKFSNGFYGGNSGLTIEMLKSVYNLHKWEKIQRSIKDIDWVNELPKKEFVDIDTMGAVACSGQACEIVF